jgi:hypothetical protein
MLTSKEPMKEISNTSNRNQTQQQQSKLKDIKNSKHKEQPQPQPKHQQITNAKNSKMAMIKRNSKRNAQVSVTKTDDLLLPGSPNYFPSLFVKKITAKYHPDSSCMSNIHGISVSHDNLIWVSHLKNCVQLLNSSGDVLLAIQLDYCPVFNCCTPAGDLLVTQGYGGDSRPVITMISRDGKSRVLADLSLYATNLCGILYENESIFVVAHSRKTQEGVSSPINYFIIKLSTTGEVDSLYKSEKEYEFINKIISLNGQIIALRTSDTAMIPLKGKMISSEKLNKVCIKSVYSASASIDNFGNVILGSYTDLFIVHPNLETMHKIDAGVGSIVSTAVDKNNQLWLGTSSGVLYSAQYLK